MGSGFLQCRFIACLGCPHVSLHRVCLCRKVRFQKISEPLEIPTQQGQGGTDGHGVFENPIAPFVDGQAFQREADKPCIPFGTWMLFRVEDDDSR